MNGASVIVRAPYRPSSARRTATLSGAGDRAVPTTHPGRPADQEDTSGWPVLHGQAGGQDTQLIAPADERGIRRDGGHAFSIAQSPYQVSVPWFSGRTDAPARPAGDAGGMDISMHTQPSTHPVKTGWVDHALADANAAGTPSAC